VTAPLQTVHVRVNDAATGKPTPCRIRFTDAKGTYYAPFGRQAEFAISWNEDLGGNLCLQHWGTGPEGELQVEKRKYAFIDGTCEVRLPAGRIHIEAHKGPEYRPLVQEIDLPAGKMALRLTIERWADLRSQGWYSGDTRCHFITPHAALLEAAAEDVAVVNLLAVEVDLQGETMTARPRRRQYAAVPNLLAFSGQRPALEVPGHMVVVNTHNYHGRKGEVKDDFGPLGELSLLNCHRVVYPLRFGGLRHGVDDWTLADWCDQCHRKGGLVVWGNVDWNADLADSSCGEALADLVLGKVDALEIYPYSGHWTFESWYKLLNCGFRVPLVGASGKDWNCVPLGLVRTYARLPEGAPLTYGNWIEAVRAGRTFVTMGPLLSFTVNGEEAGSILHLSRPAAVHVHAEACSLEPFEGLHLIVNGEVIQSVEPAGSPLMAALDVEVPLTTNSWLAAFCSYESLPPYVLTQLSHAVHTSPVYVRFDGQPLRADPETAGGLASHLDNMLEWVRERARCETDKQRQDLAAIFESARQELLRRQGG
jgi:hypothetical protein